MKNNLHQKIIQLVDRQWELKRLCGIIKYDSMRDETKRAEYETMVKEYEHNDEILHYILKNCFITPLKLADIISEQEKKKYVLKIFRETDVNVLGDTYYTGRFMVCYLNNESEFFNSNEKPVVYQSLVDKSEKYTNNSLKKEDFKRLVESIEEGKGKLVSTYEDLTFIPTLPPSCYLEGENFVTLFIYGRLDDFIYSNFQKEAKEYIKNYLENINANDFLKTDSKEDEKGEE